jgi:hypothetical protein
VRDSDDIDAKAEERALAAAEAGCARLLELLRLHHPVTHRVPNDEIPAAGKKMPAGVCSTSAGKERVDQCRNITSGLASASIPSD